MPLWTAQDRVTDTVNKVLVATLGSGDFCLIAAVPFLLDQVLARLRAVKIAIQPVRLVEGRHWTIELRLIPRPRRQAR